MSVQRAYATISPLPSANTRADCCQLCHNTYNCLWWRHSVNGICNYAWATDVLSDSNDYDLCPNGYNSSAVSFLGNADVHQADSYGIGSCAAYHGYDGENQSSQDSTDEKSFPDMCRYSGGEYCTISNFHF